MLNTLASMKSCSTGESCVSGCNRSVMLCMGACSVDFGRHIDFIGVTRARQRHSFESMHTL